MALPVITPHLRPLRPSEAFKPQTRPQPIPAIHVSGPWEGWSSAPGLLMDHAQWPCDGQALRCCSRPSPPSEARAPAGGVMPSPTQAVYSPSCP